MERECQFNIMGSGHQVKSLTINVKLASRKSWFSPSANTRLYILKQICGFYLQVCLSMYGLLVPPGIKGLVVTQSMQGNWIKTVLSITIKLFCFCRCSGIILSEPWSQWASCKFYREGYTFYQEGHIDWKERI